MAEIRYDGQVVVVTGAGRGIGRAYALDFARRGAGVVVNGRTTDEVDDVVATIEAAGGRAVPAYQSVATPDGGAAIIETALEAYQRVDVLVNNAGSLSPAYFEDLTLEQLDEVLDGQLRGTFFVTQPAWRVMKGQGYGRVLLTSSASGLFGHHGVANYAAAKAGAYGLMRVLAYEGADHGITCNLLVPVAATTIHRNAIPDMEEHRRRHHAPPERFPAEARSPDLAAALVAFLASRECTVTGEAYSTVAGRFGRVFVGVADGWLARDPSAVTAEAVRDHLDEIRDLTRYTVPANVFEEQSYVLDRLERGQHE